MPVNILWQVASARHLYRAAAEPGQTAQLWLGSSTFTSVYLSMCLVWVCGERTRHLNAGKFLKVKRPSVCFICSAVGCGSEQKEATHSVFLLSSSEAKNRLSSQQQVSLFTKPSTNIISLREKSHSVGK